MASNSSMESEVSKQPSLTEILHSSAASPTSSCFKTMKSRTSAAEVVLLVASLTPQLSECAACRSSLCSTTTSGSLSVPSSATASSERALRWLGSAVLSPSPGCQPDAPTLLESAGTPSGNCSKAAHRPPWPGAEPAQPAGREAKRVGRAVRTDPEAQSSRPRAPCAWPCGGG